MITFRNRGLVDLRAITTFGVNSKETNTAIGQFGTGFKYAVAVALRLGARITVTRGLERYEFNARQEMIRNDEFGLVYMNAQQLGFTTHLGHHWEPWQAFRELYCNMLDEAEGEAIFGEREPEEGYTHVYLDGEMFDALWNERHTVVLPPTLKPLHTDERLQVFNAPSEYLYYRGVRVAKLETPSKHTFNVLAKQDLTEDRTLQSMWSVRSTISAAVAKIESKPLLKQLLFAGRNTFENTLEFSQWVDASQAFIDVIYKGRANQDINTNALAYYRVKNPQVTLPKRVKKLQMQEKRDLKNAVQLCAVLGYDIQGYPPVVTDELPDNVLGCVYPKHSDNIYLSRRMFAQGLNTVAGTLLEEFLHLKYGLDDNSRQMQNHLLDALIRAAQRLQLAPGAPTGNAAPE